MGFFSRLANLWKGFLSIFIGDIEEKHPEIAYENAINAMTEKYATLKTAAAGLIKNRSKLEARIQKNEAALEELKYDLEAALAKEDDEIALVLIERQDQLVADVESAKKELNQAVNDAESVKESLRAVKAEIENLKRERDTTVAKIKSAEARKQIQEQLDGLTVDDELKALENVREYRDRIEAEVQIGDELEEGSLEGKLKEIRKEGAKNKARARLEQLKAQRAGASEPEATSETVAEAAGGDAGADAPDAGGDAPAKNL